MSFPNHLPTESYEGSVDGITIKWGPNAINNLPENARLFGKDVTALKGATEHLAHATAKRLGKTAVRILGSFHNTTTVTSTKETRQDACHCSISVSPGGTKVHIYVNLTNTIPIDQMKVLGESVVLSGKSQPDPTLSIGTYSSM